MKKLTLIAFIAILLGSCDNKVFEAPEGTITYEDKRVMEYKKDSLQAEYYKCCLKRLQRDTIQ